MNAIFTVITVVSSIILLFTNPDAFLTSMLSGAGKALTLAATLFAVYAVWLSISAMSEKCGVNRAAARLIKPAAAKFFRTDNSEACENIAMNVTCNLLGIGGAATPFGIKAAELLGRDGNERAQELLFILNAASVQLFPATVTALRAAAGSADAGDIFLPTLICSAVCTSLSLTLYAAVNRLWRR